MRRKKLHSSDLVCSCCGNMMTIPRPKNEGRKKYHIKDLYCVMCMKVTKFIELGSADIVKKELEFKPELNYIEELVYDLIKDESEIEKCKQKII